jgi:hypothetical protein
MKTFIFAIPAATPAPSLVAKEDFLEAEPYYDQSNVPVNVYKKKEPFNATVVSTKRIVGPKATEETVHIIIDHGGDFPFWEGQSWGVIPQGFKRMANHTLSVCIRLPRLVMATIGQGKLDLCAFVVPPTSTLYSAPPTRLKMAFAPISSAIQNQVTKFC